MTISAFSSSSSSASAPRSPFRQLLNNKTVAKDSSKDEKSPLPSTTPTSSVPSSTAPPSDGPKSPFRDPNASIFGDKIKNSFQRASEHQRQVNQKSSTSSSWNTNDRNNQPRRDQRQSNQRIPFQQSRTETGSKDSKQQAKQQQPKIDPAQISGPDEDAESDAETLAAERAHLAPVYSGQARHEQKLVHLEHKRKEVEAIPFLSLSLFNLHQMAAKVPAIPPEPFKKPRKSPQSDELEEADLVDVPEDDLFEEVHDDYEAYIAKKKKLSQLPPEPAADTPTQPDHGKNFYSATGPLTVAELKRIAAERLQYRAEKLATIEPKVDYRELKKEKRHEKANLLKAKRAALREKLYGPKKVPTIIKEIRIPSNGLTVKELAMKLSRPVVDTIQELEKLGELVAGRVDSFSSDLMDLQRKGLRMSSWSLMLLSYWPWSSG